jgi:hypothetical protein
MDERIRVLVERRRAAANGIVTCPSCAGWVKWMMGRGWRCGICSREWDLLPPGARTVVWE